MALHVFGFSTDWAIGIAIAALVGVTWSGYHTWKRGQGFQTYIESALYHNLAGAADTGGAEVVDYSARQVTGPAFVLSQIFLGGPLFALRGLRHFNSFSRARPDWSKSFIPRLASFGRQTSGSRSLTIPGRSGRF
jgi:hypothetical protein